jgi:hypothetical protein
MWVLLHDVDVIMRTCIWVMRSARGHLIKSIRDRADGGIARSTASSTTTLEQRGTGRRGQTRDRWPPSGGVAKTWKVVAQLFRRQRNGLHSGGVAKTYRLITGVRVEICIATPEVQRILTDETLKCRAVVPRAIVIQSGSVVLSPGELVRIGTRRAAYRAVAERIVRILGLDAAGGASQGDAAAQDVGKIIVRARSIAPLEVLVDAKTGQHVRARGATLELLHRIQAVVRNWIEVPLIDLRVRRPDRVIYSRLRSRRDDFFAQIQRA